VTIPPHVLTFLAEGAGNDPRPTTVAWLVALLRHPSPVVREGAVLGLAKVDTPEARRALEHHTDKSPGVRAVAKEMLETMHRIYSKDK
jgi:HEAT repeat protein